MSKQENNVDPMKCPLKVGDQVEVVGPCWRGFTGRIGERARIQRIGLSGDIAISTNPAARGYWFPRSSLRLVEPEPAKVSPAPNPSAASDSSPSATGEEWKAHRREVDCGTAYEHDDGDTYSGFECSDEMSAEVAAILHNAAVARLAAAHRAEVEQMIDELTAFAISIGTDPTRSASAMNCWRWRRSIKKRLASLTRKQGEVGGDRKPCS